MSAATTENTEVTEAEEKWTLTPFALISGYVTDSDANKVVDAIELYMRRAGVGMAIDNNRLSFVPMEPVEEVLS